MEFKKNSLSVIGDKDYNPIFVDPIFINENDFEQEIVIKSDLSEEIEDKYCDDPMIQESSKMILVGQNLDANQVGEVEEELMEQHIYDDADEYSQGVKSEDGSKDSIITLVKDPASEFVPENEKVLNFYECYEQEILIGGDGSENFNESCSSDETSKGNNAEGLMECTICLKKVKASSLRQHMQTHRGLKPFKCELCLQHFTRKTDCVRHMFKLHGIQGCFENGQQNMEFVCKMCTRTFKNYKHLKEHQKSHEKSNIYYCKLCKFKCTKLEYFVNHSRFSHPPNERVDNLPETDRLHSIDDTSDINYVSMGACLESVDNFNTNMSKIPMTSNITLKNAVKNYEEGDYHEFSENIDSPPDIVDEDSNDSFFRAESLSEFDKSNKNSIEIKRLNELVDKAINAAIVQSEKALLDIQSSIKVSKSLKANNDVDLNNEKLIPIIKSENGDTKNSELQIRANVGGHIHKFIVQIPYKNNIDASKPEGMEILVNMVNQLCAGKGEVTGPVEVVFRPNL